MAADTPNHLITKQAGYGSSDEIRAVLKKVTWGESERSIGPPTRLGLSEGRYQIHYQHKLGAK